MSEGTTYHFSCLRSLCLTPAQRWEWHNNYTVWFVGCGLVCWLFGFFESSRLKCNVKEGFKNR